MYRFTPIALIVAALLMTDCLAGSSDPPPRTDGVRYSLVVFDGASSKTIVEGKIADEQYTKWFTQDYGVGGERIETPKSSISVGALVLVSGEKTIVMPLCTWQIKTGHTYFACQSDAIGQAPMFSVCTESKTQTEFLKQMEHKLVKLQENGG